MAGFSPVGRDWVVETGVPMTADRGDEVFQSRGSGLGG
jgi:hypothetical protein